MASRTHEQVACMLCGAHVPGSATVPARLLRQPLTDSIAARHPTRWSPDGRLCRRCLDTERTAHVVRQLEQERGELGVLEAEVSRRAAEHSAIAAHIGQRFERELTLGQRLADAVAAIGGSWPFVIGFAVVLAIWVVLNAHLLGGAPFDPYPFILLNLVLSCLAAVQAPVIMMSQNRAAARDRMEADEDFKVNLKAELEIAALHEKVDHLLHTQWDRMVELQQTQLEMLQELRERRR